MYEARPLALTPRKAERILNEMIRHETMFSDYQPACDEHCGYCLKCLERKATIVSKLVAPNTMAWEVWKDDDLTGIIYLRDIVPGHDALAEITFWDKDLRGKSNIIDKTLERAVFGSDLGLHRVTVEVPEYMHALRRWLERYLKFEHEGTKREAMLWQDKWHDVHILARLNKNVIR